MKRRKLLSIVLSICVILAFMPQMAFAADSTPSVSAYATKAQLMDAFSSENTDNIGRLIFGKNSEGKPQQWYVLGKDNGVEGDNTVLFAASPVIKGQVFEDDWENNKTDSSLWKDCTYTGTAPSEVYPNHYGASDLRAALKSMTGSANTSYFTAAEKDLLNDTKVTTWDAKNNVIYEVTDSLYAPMADNFGDKAIKVGSGDSIVLAMSSYWGNADSPFWLRTPLVYEDVNSLALSATPNDQVDADMVNNPLAVRPASNLKLTDVLFASAAEAAADEPVSGTVSQGSAMTLRLDGSDKDIGSVMYNDIADCITAVKGGAEGDVALAVQGNDGTSDWYYSKPVDGTAAIPVSDIEAALDLTSDINVTKCRIWLETIDADGMTYAVNMPDYNIVTGDINGDGIANGTDAAAIQKYLAGLIPQNDILLGVYDINCNGIIDISDCTMLLKVLNYDDISVDGIQRTPTPSRTVTSRKSSGDTLKVNASSNYFRTVSETVGGDEEYVTVTYYISSKKDMLDTQWTLTYDPEFLEFDPSFNYGTSGSAVTLMPMVNSLVWNNVTDGKYGRIKANASRLELFEFADRGLVPFVTATFRILQRGETEVNLNVECLTLSSDDGTDKEEYAVVNSTVNDTPNQPERIVVPHAGLYSPDFPGHNLEKVEGKNPTYIEAGYMEFWHCKYCDRYYSDPEANNEITDLENWKTGEGKIDKLPMPVKTDSVTAAKDGSVTVTLNKSITTSGTKTTATVTDTVAEQILTKLASSESKSVVIDASAGSAASTAVVISESAMKKLAEVEGIEITLVTDSGRVVLDNKTITSIAASAGNDGQVTLSIETVERSNNLLKVDISISTSGGYVTEFSGGKVTVTVVIDDELKGKNPVAVYIDDEGRYYKLGGTLNDDGTFTFVTGHFSTYAIMPEADADKVIKEQAIAAVKKVKTTVTLSTKSVKKGIKVTVKVPASQKADKTGIIIYRSTKKSSGYAVYKKVKTSGSTYTVTNTLNVKGNRLVQGKRYYYKARVYKVIDGKTYYGLMSGVKYMRAK